MSEKNHGSPLTKSGVTEYFDPPENPGLGPNFTEKVGPPSHTRHLIFSLNINSTTKFLCFLNIKYKDALNLNIFVIKYTKYSDNSIDKG